MATTPARIPPKDGTPLGSARKAGREFAEGTQDTERPPMLGEDETTDADVLPPSSLAGHRPFAPDAASGLEQGGLGPPTPRALRAAPALGAAGPSSSRLAAAPPLPLSPVPTPRAPPARAYGAVANAGGAPFPGSPLATSHPSKAHTPAPPVRPPVPDGTSVGLAPVLAAGVPLRSNSMTGVAAPLTRRCTSCNELYPDDFLVCPRDATPLAAAEGADAADDPLVGSLIGETYQIVRIIGEGGMGRVYEARHLRLKERRFAVKCLHSELARNQEMAARFLREAESASSIKHPNVVDVFDVHHLADGTPYLVGEYLEGEELADYVTKRGPLEMRTAARIGRQVCSALSAAHARGIVHRDMKPENVFVLGASIEAVDRAESRTLNVKVLDFGISKAGPSDKSHLTRTGVIMGTPSYMSPEQARGRPVDHRADVYSVGACMYYMVTGRRPFDSDDPTSTLSMVLTEEPLRPREIDPRIPEMLELIIQRAMAKDANDRYASMEDLDKALAVLVGRSSIAVPSGHMIQAPASNVSELQTTGAARAFDVAKAMLGSESMAPPSMQQSGNIAATARPTIVITSGALGGWLVGGTVAALAGLVRVLHDGEVTPMEASLLVAGCLFAAATPIALYVMHLRKVIWPNSVRALQLAKDLTRVAVSAFVTYGALSILGRIVHTVLWRSSRGLASGVWDIALFLVSLGVAITLGGFAPFLRNLRRRRVSHD